MPDSSISVTANNKMIYEPAESCRLYQCQTVKQLCKIQAAFMKATHCETWDDPCKKYPNFTTTVKLESFKKLNFSVPTIPEEFMKFCQVAQNYMSDYEDITKIHHDDNNIFLLQHKGAIGLFYQINVLNISTDTLNEIFEKVYVTIIFMAFVAILHIY